MKKTLHLLTFLFILLMCAGTTQAQLSMSSGGRNYKYGLENLKVKLPHDFQSRLAYATSDKKIHQLTSQRIDSLWALIRECESLLCASGWKDCGGDEIYYSQDFSERYPINLFLKIKPELTYYDIQYGIGSDLKMPLRDKSLFETGATPTSEYKITAEEQIQLLGLDDGVIYNVTKFWKNSGSQFSSMVEELQNGKRLSRKHYLGKNGGDLMDRIICYDCSKLYPQRGTNTPIEQLEAWRQASSITQWKAELEEYALWVERFNESLTSVFNEYLNTRGMFSQMTTEYFFTGEDNAKNFYTNMIRVNRKNRMLQSCKGGMAGIQAPIYTFEDHWSPAISPEYQKEFRQDSTYKTGFYYAYFAQPGKIRNTYSAGFICDKKWKSFNIIETPAFAMEVFQNDQIVIKNKELIEGSVTTYLEESSQSLLIAYFFSDLLKDIEPSLATSPIAEKFTVRNDTVYLKTYTSTRPPVEYLKDGDIGSPYYLFGKNKNGEFTVFNMQGIYQYYDQLNTCVHRFSTNNWYECMLAKQLHESYSAHSANKKKLEQAIVNINNYKYVEKLKAWDAKVKSCDYCKKDYKGTPYTYRRNSYGGCDGFDRIVGGCSPFIKGGNCCSPKCAQELCEFEK